MKQSPSWGATRFSASEEIPPFYGTQRFITAFTTAHHVSLSWDRTVQSLHTPYILKIHFNIISPSTSGSCKWTPSLRSSDQNPVYTSLFIRAICLVYLFLLTYLETWILKNLGSWEEILEPEDYFCVYNHVFQTLMLNVPYKLYFIGMIASVLPSLWMSGTIPQLPSMSLFGTHCMWLKNQIVNYVWISWWIFVAPHPNIMQSVNVWLVCFPLSVIN